MLEKVQLLEGPILRRQNRFFLSAFAFSDGVLGIVISVRISHNEDVLQLNC